MLLSDLIALQSRSGKEEGEERCEASVETDDDAWAGCMATLCVALSMKSLDNCPDEL